MPALSSLHYHGHAVTPIVMGVSYDIMMMVDGTMGWHSTCLREQL
jgi:hypothetical protein